jgi:hypothetical protein
MKKPDDSLPSAHPAPAPARRRPAAISVSALGLAACLALSFAGVGAEPAPEAKAAPAADPQVKLLEAGAAPRHKLRLHPKAGDKQTADLTFRIAIDTQAAGGPGGPMKMPPMKVALQLTVKSVSSDGRVAYDLLISDAGVGDDPDAMPQLVDQIKSSMAGLKGISGTGVVTDRGFNRGVEMNTPPGADAQLHQALEQAKEAVSRMAAPLPEEPVGAGASWRFDQPIKSQGMTINQTITYQLVSQEGDRLTAKTSIVQSAAEQKLQAPAEMQGADLKLLKMEGHGDGTVTSDLGKILPIKATADMHSDLTMQMTLGGQANSMVMRTDVKFEIQPK